MNSDHHDDHTVWLEFKPHFSLRIARRTPKSSDWITETASTGPKLLSVRNLLGFAESEHLGAS